MSRNLKEERKAPMQVSAGREKNQCKGPEAGDCRVRGRGSGGKGARVVMEASQRSWLRLELLFWVEGKPVE